MYLYAVYRHNKSQQKQLHLEMSKWRLRFITEQEVYKSGPENLSGFKM